MVITVAHCWAPEINAGLVCVLMDPEVVCSFLRAVTKIPTLFKWSVSATQATRDLNVRNVLLVTMATLGYQGDGATHVNVMEILICRTLNHVTHALVLVSNACFTLMAPSASTVVVATMEMPVHRTVGDACAIS